MGVFLNYSLAMQASQSLWHPGQIDASPLASLKVPRIHQHRAHAKLTRAKRDKGGLTGGTGSVQYGSKERGEQREVLVVKLDPRTPFARRFSFAR